MSYLDTKEHKEWAIEVKHRDHYKCIVCKSEKNLTAHHLIPKENRKYRSNVNNGVTLCAKHHMRFGYNLSPHSHGSFMFFVFLKNWKPEIFKWVEQNCVNEILHQMEL